MVWVLMETSKMEELDNNAEDFCLAKTYSSILVVDRCPSQCSNNEAQDTAVG